MPLMRPAMAAVSTHHRWQHKETGKIFVGSFLASNAQHTGYCQNLKCKPIKDFAEMVGIEYARISKNTDIYPSNNELRLSEVYCR